MRSCAVNTAAGIHLFRTAGLSSVQFSSCAVNRPQFHAARRLHASFTHRSSLKPHLRRTHQPPLAPGSAESTVQDGRAHVQGHSWNCAVIPESTRLVRVADLPGRRSLRSGLVPSVKLSTVGGRAFPVAGPTICNSLPCRTT